MRYQVPQFVDIEDKIIGPFTLKQFLTYLVGVLLLIPVFIASDLSLFILIAIPVMGVCVALAHVRIHGKSLFGVIGSAFNFVSRGQVFIWQRTGEDKPLRISGEEYGDFATDPSQLPVGSSTLSSRARDLETAGNIVKEDIADPFAGETNE